jgi:N-acetylmuramoyl-L-alanine amidase
VLALVSGAFCFFAFRSAPTVQDNTAHRPLTVVLDAGHGGEDGGASSASGLVEKDLNLDIAFRVKKLLESAGVSVVMTRETDILLYDKTTDYQGRKKALDLAARRKIAEETEDAIFVSIHMNAYPQTQYQGLQVWYSPNHETSANLAKNLQNTAKLHLQPTNNRQVKPATSSIYLLHRLTCPAILVECGFLSNPSEAARLADEAYRTELAFVIFYSILDGCDS